MRSFGERFKMLCDYTKLSKEDLEKYLEMPIKKISALQQNMYRSIVTEKEVRRVLNRFEPFGIECSLNWLVFGTGKQPHCKVIS